MRASFLAEMLVAGASSISFWWRRCTEQSRVPRWITLPAESARTWTSTWRASDSSRSAYSVPSPKARSHSCASSPIELRSMDSVWMIRMPRPPPPAAALTIIG